MDNPEQTIQNRPSRIDNPETLVTRSTQDKGQINVRENQRSYQEWTIQRNWQHWTHKTQDEDKQNKKQHRKLN
jgi:hypothetical protein